MCGCNGRSTSTTTNYNSDGTVSTTPVIWRLKYPNGLEVDYWSEKKGREDEAQITGSRLVKTNPRTGEELP
jgi:hypothetical protein